MAVSQSLSVTEVSGSVNATDNTSKVRILWTSTQTNNSHNNNTKTAKYYVSINGGAETEYSVSYTLPLTSTKTIVDTTITVAHKADGSGTVSVRTWMDTSISAGVVQKSKTLTLTTIPRASTISSALNRTLGDACSVSWTPLAKTFTYKLKFSIGSWSYTTGVIRPNTTASYTYADYKLSLDAAHQLPKSPQGTMKVILSTYSDNNGTIQVGSDASVNITVTVPNNDSTKPSVSMPLTPVSSLNPPYNTLYIQGKSKVESDLSGTGNYSATITTKELYIDGKSNGTLASDYLSKSGKVTVKGRVYDSRGYYNEATEDIEVIPYIKPYVQAKSGESSIIAARCDSSANFTDSGTYLKIKAKTVFSKVISDGVQNNYGKIKFRYRKEGGTYSAWQTILDCKTDNSDEVITQPLLNGALDIQSNYQVQIIASDDFHDSEPITIAVPSDAVYMDRPAGGKSMGLGGYSSGDGTLDVHWKTKARGGLSMFDSKGDEIPLDTTLPYPRGQVTEGWSPDNLENGTYVVTNSKPLKDSGGNVIMYNGVLIQMNGTVDGSVRIQLALTSDETRNPFYRAYWYGNWGNWRSMKL